VTSPIRVDRFAWERRIRAPESELTTNQVCVLLLLGTYMDADGSRAHPGVPALVAGSRLSDSTVRRVLTFSTGHGWLLLIRRGHRRGDGSTVASEYAATLPTSIGHGVERSVSRPVSTGQDRDRLTNVSTGHDDDRLTRSLPVKGSPLPVKQPVSTGHLVTTHQALDQEDQAAARTPNGHRPNSSTGHDPAPHDVRSVLAQIGRPAWGSDAAAALGRGCTVKRIVEVVNAPMTGDVHSPDAVRRRRLRDVMPVADAVRGTPMPPRVRDMCRQHTQPQPCPVCADIAADNGMPVS
jgi:hypothetical protein